MKSSDIIISLISFLQHIYSESRILKIRVPINLYVEIIDKLLHLMRVYRQNESFVYIYYEDDLYFIKETVLYKDEIAYDIIRNKLKISFSSFFKLINDICNADNESCVKEILKNIR